MNDARPLMVIRRARRPVRVPVMPNYAPSLDSLFCVMFSRHRVGTTVMHFQTWRD